MTFFPSLLCAQFLFCYVFTALVVAAISVIISVKLAQEYVSPFRLQAAALDEKKITVSFSFISD